MTKGRKAVTAAAFALALSVPTFTRADIVINAVETGGGDVVFSYSGSIDTSGLGAPSSSSTGSPGFNAPAGYILFGVAGTLVDIWSGLGTLPAFGTGLASADSTTGTAFGFAQTVVDVFVIEDGYVSDSPISGSITYNNETFASLGLTPGTYQHSLPDDTVTLNIGVAQVPEPTTLALLGIALAGLGFSRRKRSYAEGSRG